MNVSVIGTGYVGLVVGACLAETGHDVVCADVIEEKIARLKRGEIPIFEPGLEPLVHKNVEEGRLRFTTDVDEAVRASGIIFIAVGTPPGEDGSADLQHVLAVARAIGRSMDGERIVITKSTVPVGTAARVRATVQEHTTHPVHVCSNPEFLKEGAAVEDFMKPDRVVLGVDDEGAAETLRSLYEPFVRTGNQILIMDVASAEITKYAANAMLATRISFMNMIARLCEATGADVDQVRLGIGSDARIGPSFLFPGIGYGGSCLVGEETVLVRGREGVTLVPLSGMFEQAAPAPRSTPGDLEPEVVWTEDLEVLSWDAERGAVWRPVQAATRRWYEGDLVEVRTTMGRRVRCTPDHPFVVAEAGVGVLTLGLAADLRPADRLPLIPSAVLAKVRIRELTREAVAAGAIPMPGHPVHPAWVTPDECPGTEWVAITDTPRAPFRGWVYSLEVPGTETFVTTGGLVVHNCFPKDVKALSRTIRGLDLDNSILEAVESVNEGQKRLLLEHVVDRFGEDLSGRTFAVWGLAFKPNTDDMREAPSLVTIEGLLERGARVVAHDPVAMDEARRHLGDRIEYRERNYDALEGADALLIHTEWHPYRRPDYERVLELLAQPIVFDGRNLWKRDELEKLGFEYHSVGRPPVIPEGVGG